MTATSPSSFAAANSTTNNGKTGSSTATNNGGKEYTNSNLWWAVGHASFLLCSLLYLVSGSRFFYKTGVLGLVASYGTDVYRAYSASSTGAALAETLFLSDKMPYFVLAIMMYFMTPVSVLLLPFIVYSLYDAMIYARSNPLITRHPIWNQYFASPSSSLLPYHQQAMYFATQLEILAAPWILFSIFSIGITWPILYTGLIRWQYFVSSRTKIAFNAWDQIFTKATEHPSCPKSLRKAYNVIKGILKKWVAIRAPPSQRASSVRVGK